ncbi:PhzF family phenazine biosynthesis protein [Chitinophaga sp. Hz27]|uniref:PhzF family phenazine biosynthesis protein n=1 Tax=Chitinophaga sp. Hz27 TaxID=3347169 RepID=UPI0035DDEE89
MEKLDYYVLDVFTDQRYAGNQLSVVHLQHTLSLEQYHQISREFGYSETSFVLFDTVAQIFKVRSFTPAGFEVEGAGHNLLGAVCLAILQDWNIFRAQGDEPVVLIKDTRIPLKIEYKEGVAYVAMKQRPISIPGTVPMSDVAAAVGLSTQELLLHDWQINIVQTEVPHLMVPVRDLQALEKAACHKPLLKSLSARYGFEGVYLFTTEGIAAGYLAEARFFNPGMGIDEDPATGTAAGPLAGYLANLEYIPAGESFRILQGKYIAHPSDIQVQVVSDGIWVSGTSVIVMEGKIFV